MLIRFGSMIVLRKRVKKPGLTVTISAPARCSVNGRCASFVVVAVELLQEAGSVGAIVSIDVHLQRLLRREVRRDAHRFRRPFRVAVMGLRECLQGRDRVVDHLPPQVVAEVLSARVDRRRRADVRVGRHGEHVGRLRDPDAGRGGARAFRRDVDDDRHLRAPARPGRSSSSTSRGRRACRGGSRRRRNGRSPPARACS